ncbi:MAG TPA: hypothetical protein VD864_00110 [Nocardioides sp.]|nr:hypothetical protein [Nocardioides sp.]
MAGLKWHGDAVIRLIEAAGSRGVDEGIDIIGDLSQERVLVQTGDLKRSRRTVRQGLQAAVGYTDSKAVGAHENLAVTPDRKKNPQARPKFLESAANDSHGKVRDAVADNIRKVL